MLLHARTSRCNLRPTSETPAGRGGCPSASAPGILANPTTRIDTLSAVAFSFASRFAKADVRSGRSHRLSRRPENGPGWASRCEKKGVTGMQVRSWMAAWSSLAGSTLLLSGVARSQKSGSDQPPPGPKVRTPERPKPQDSQNPSVQENKPTAEHPDRRAESLDRRPGPGWLRGRDQAGEPKHSLPAATPARRVQGKAKFVFRDIEVRGADRNCTFAITVHEPGQASRTIFRGFRIASRLARRSRDPGRPEVHLLHELPVQAGGTGTDRPDQTISAGCQTRTESQESGQVHREW